MTKDQTLSVRITPQVREMLVVLSKMDDRSFGYIVSNLIAAEFNNRMNGSQK